MDYIRLFWWIPVSAIIILAVLGERFLLSPFLKWLGKRAKGRKIRCRQCKGEMTDIASSLYLLPVYFDHIHERSAAYYRKNAKAIVGIEQVPTGNRACRMTVLQCPACGCKEVRVIDFLPVRGQEVIEGTGIYSYSEFEDFFYNTEYAKAEEFSAVKKQESSVERTGR